jgi:ATP-binding cassette, subfamily B, multidrug efflux pump
MAAEEEAIVQSYDTRLLRRLLGYLRPYWWQTLIALVAIVAKAGVDVVGPYLTAVAIDRYLSGKPDIDRFINRYLPPQGSPWEGITAVCLLYLAALALSWLLEFTQTYVMQWVGQKALFDLRTVIFDHLQRLHVAFFDKNPVGRLVTRVTTDVDALNDMFTNGVVALFEDLFVLIFIMLIMLKMDAKLALVTFAVLPFIIWCTAVFRRAVRDSNRRIRVAIAKINSYLQEHVSGMLVLQLFNREDRSYREFDRVNKQHMLAYKDAIMAHALYYPAVEILSAVAIAATIWYGGLQVLIGEVKVGVLVAFILYAQRFFRPIMDLSEKYVILQTAVVSSERIFKLLDTKPEIESPGHPVEVESRGRIEFDRVWFAYRELPQSDGQAADRIPPFANDGRRMGHPQQNGHLSDDERYDWILRDVSFTIEPGETAAIVGHTGAGKTTIISLLLRFYDVQKGSIRIDGVDIRQMSLESLRRRFGVVLQDPFLFSGTIAENIRLGTTDVTDARIERAAEEVNVADFIRALPHGFDEPVRERGSTLSTGQKQLISFARALAHDPKVLILDEATSSVDTETEVRVRSALSKLVEGRTSVIIAHRLSTIQQADKILVMHKGKLRELGTHQQLLAERGIYWKLYQLQYKDQELPIAT